MYCQTEVPASQEPSQGQDSQPIFITTTHWVDCSVQGGKIIRKVNKDCIVFRHEDFGRQLVWALQRYVQVNIQGPEQSFFEEETQELPTAPGEGTNQHNEPSQATAPANTKDASNAIPNNAEEQTSK